MLLIIYYIDELICNRNKSIGFFNKFIFPWFVPITKSFLSVYILTEITYQILCFQIIWLLQWRFVFHECYKNNQLFKDRILIWDIFIKR